MSNPYDLKSAGPPDPHITSWTEKYIKNPPAAKAEMRNAINNADGSIPDAAKDLDMSPRHLHRLIKRVPGIEGKVDLAPPGPKPKKKRKKTNDSIERSIRNLIREMIESSFYEEIEISEEF